MDLDHQLQLMAAISESIMRVATADVKMLDAQRVVQRLPDLATQAIAEALDAIGQAKRLIHIVVQDTESERLGNSIQALQFAQESMEQGEAAFRIHCSEAVAAVERAFEQDAQWIAIVSSV